MALYSLYSRGQIKTGFDLDQVQNKLVTVFKLAPETASALVNSQRRIKKDLDRKAVQVYRQKLEGIGLLVVVKEQREQASKPAALSLSLEPMEGESHQEAPVVSPPLGQSAPSSCPKCGHVKTNATQCDHCGVFFSKVSDVESPRTSLASAGRSLGEAAANHGVSSADRIEVENKKGILALLVAAIVAVVGAFIWKAITTSSGYEYGFVAWLLGGAVGFSAALLGARGQVIGVACALLTAAAILGGKYLVYEEYKEYLAQEFFSSDDMQGVYQEHLKTAQDFLKNVDDENSLRRFMIRHQYTDATSVEDITDEEIAFFNENEKHYLEGLSSSQEDFSNGQDGWAFQFVDKVSIIDLMIEDFDFMDALFLFLGVMTAFRLGRGSD